MVCGGCVQKLASKLVRHHKNLDWIRALELAEKGVERVQNRKIGLGVAGKDDYTLTCVGSTPGYPHYCGTQNCLAVVKPVQMCRATSDCTGTCTCSEPTVEHSHLVRDGCNCGPCCGYYSYAGCPEGCSCHCTGTCGYDCDEGYSWNGEECVLAAQSDSQALSSIFILRNKALKALSSLFTIQRTSFKSFSGYFTIQKWQSATLPSNFIIQHQAIEDFSATFTLQKAGSEPLSSLFTIQKLGTNILSSSFTISGLYDDTITLSTSFIIQQMIYKDFPSSFTLQYIPVVRKRATGWPLYAKRRRTFMFREKEIEIYELLNLMEALD